MGEFVTYSTRWFVLKAVVLMNMGCYLLNVSLAAVSTSAAKYYEVSGDKIDIISISQNLVSIPGIWIGIFLIEKLELIKSLRLASGISVLGCFIRAGSTFPLWEKSLNSELKFWLTFMGQITISMGYPICTIMTTKVSQVWFSEKERPISTALMAMSQMVGALIGQGMSTLIVRDDPKNIPMLNLLLPMPILVSCIICYLILKNNSPITPPSRSAQFLIETEEVRTLSGVWKDVKCVLSNATARMLAIGQGSTIGGTLLILTQLNQYMCARNYSTEQSSLVVVIGILSGIIGAFVVGQIVKRLNIQKMYFKISYYILTLVFAIFLFSLTLQDAYHWIVILGVLNFFIGCSIFAVALELAVEETYPIDPIIGEACIHMVGQILGIIYVMVGNVIYWELPAGSAQSCSNNEIGVIARDYTPFFYSLSGLQVLLSIGVFLFVNPTMNRQNEDRRVV
ncbi:solute carrier family 49 member A3 [Lepeophtheirus salmonis]|nr:solute carrier family 49 member A3-like [Lepeophtheirus salmonis]